MKKILIADDDFIVRTYLKQMLDWESQGYLLLNEAKNGKEALNICLEQQPDIIITDMSMPVMNGMELLREIKQRSLPVNVLILSCHDDFAYVKEAMKLGADDYLLKNDLTPESLLSALRKIQPLPKDSDEKRSEDNADISTLKLASIGRRKLQSDFFASFINPQMKDSAVLKEQAQQAGISSSFNRTAAILIELKKWQARLNKLEHSDLISFGQAFADMCKNICQSPAYTAAKIKYYVFHADEYSSLWHILIDFSNLKSTAEIHKILYSISDKLHAYIQRYFALEAVCYQTSLSSSLWDLKQNCHELNKLTACSFYASSPLFCQDDTPIPLESASLQTKQLLQQAAQALNGSDEEFERFLADFFAELQAGQYTLPCLKQIISELSAKLQLPHPLDWVKIEDFAALQTIFRENINEHRQQLLGQSSCHPAIRNALKYIASHYREPISLQQVADFVHLNPAYFSSLFKKSMQITFSDYLIACRLDSVKKRLRQDSGRIKDIAAQEGFADYQYFCKLFKRVVGINPRDFRHKN